MSDSSIFVIFRTSNIDALNHSFLFLSSSQKPNSSLSKKAPKNDVELQNNLLLLPIVLKSIDVMKEVNNDKANKILSEYWERKNILGLYKDNVKVNRSSLDYLLEKGTKISLPYLNDFVAKSEDKKLKKYAADVINKVIRK